MSDGVQWRSRVPTTRQGVCNRRLAIAMLPATPAAMP